MSSLQQRHSCGVAGSWASRIARVQKLFREYGTAAEVLRFYGFVLRFQEALYRNLKSTNIPSVHRCFRRPLWTGLASQFCDLFAIVEEHGPGPLADAAREMRQTSPESTLTALTAFWMGNGAETSGGAPEDFLKLALLQPYAEFIRLQITLTNPPHMPCQCPHCGSKPVAGVLRQLGDGGQRFLLCSLCLGEWGFRRILCPACGEENHTKLPVYRAEEFRHMRVECCDTCKTYTKTVDMTVDGFAEPIVDDIATLSLDLWAQNQGYSKLQVNLMQV